MAVSLLKETTIVSFPHNSDSQEYSFNKEYIFIYLVFGDPWPLKGLM